MLEIMSQDSRDEHVKTVYAHFGLALYLAQILEHGLANALISAELLPRRTGKPVPKTQWEADFKPLGRLISGLRKATSVPVDLEALLTTALKTRNFLAHHFFRERAESFMSCDGREKMIKELESAQRLFEAADEKLTVESDSLRRRFTPPSLADHARR